MFVLIRWNEQFESSEDGLLHECSQCEQISGGEFVIKDVYGPFETEEAAEAARPARADLNGDHCVVMPVKLDANQKDASVSGGGGDDGEADPEGD